MSHNPTIKIGLAVSGGIDSCYLMHFYARHNHSNIEYYVLSVDHGLRPESALEVTQVLSWASDLGLKAYRLNITAPKPQSGIQNFARNQRYALLADAAKTHNLDYVYLGHHSDDQTETILSRLNHKSGYAGLCGMAEMFFYNNICFKRPLLNLSKAEINANMRHYHYINDPSNDNQYYERVRNRYFLRDNLCLKTRLLKISNNAKALYYPLLYQRNIFLEAYAEYSPYGYCRIQRDDFEKQDALMQQEILKYAIKYATGNFYIKDLPPLTGKNFTISNAEICFNKYHIFVYRENRGIIINDPKRFVIKNEKKEYPQENIPSKALKTLPNYHFIYKPQSLYYFVSIFNHFTKKL
ncbi:MAG: tRNA(Ile)-lysidine synthetase-like protein [Dasania sp.]|jgi:tRNA(Ile)-lysidine synthetase-like protein